MLLGLLLLPLPREAPEAQLDCVMSRSHLSIKRKHNHCALALRAPKVALLFLLVGEMLQKEVWVHWFSKVGATAFNACRGWSKTEQFLTRMQQVDADPIAQQHVGTRAAGAAGLRGRVSSLLGVV